MKDPFRESAAINVKDRERNSGAELSCPGTTTTVVLGWLGFHEVDYHICLTQTRQIKQLFSWADFHQSQINVGKVRAACLFCVAQKEKKKIGCKSSTPAVTDGFTG